MHKALVYTISILAFGLLGACASNGNSSRADDSKSLAEKWDEDQAKQEERTRQETAEERLDRATRSTTGSVGGALGGSTDRLIGR